MNWATNESLPFGLEEGDVAPTSTYLANEDASTYNPINTRLPVGKVQVRTQHKRGRGSNTELIRPTTRKSF